MIIYMSDIICVTNRKLSGEPFLERIEKIAKAHPRGILLREKDMQPEEYKKLAMEVMEICRREEITFILHSFAGVAMELNASDIHLPLPLLRRMSASAKREFKRIGASCHSVNEALEAQRLGCNYITAGHIFETDCKRGIPGRGHEFLKEICQETELPVYAIGGISPENIEEIRRDGAAGACLMSSVMTCKDPSKLLKAMEKNHGI